MPGPSPSAKRHNLVGRAIDAAAQPISSCSERGPLERLCLDPTVAPCDGAERGRRARRAAPEGRHGRPRPNPREQPSLPDRRDPRRQRRPTRRLEAHGPRANPSPRLPDRMALQPVQAEGQADRRRRVVAAGGEPLRQNRREPAAALAAVATDLHHQCFRLSRGPCRAPDLPLAKTMAHQYQRLSRRPARCATLAASARPHLLRRRDFLRPLLDDHRRIDDSFTALSSLHRDRARRETSDDQSAVSRHLFLADSASLARSLRGAPLPQRP